jgi:hypothetical protein
MNTKLIRATLFLGFALNLGFNLTPDNSVSTHGDQFVRRTMPSGGIAHVRRAK